MDREATANDSVDLANLELLTFRMGLCNAEGADSAL